MIPYGRQNITEEDIQAVEAILRSDYLTQGPVVPEFEKQLAEKVKVKYALAHNSATSALHTACMALGLSSGDYLWTSPISFVASANCGLYCGAQIDFVDIDPKTYNICANALEEKLHTAQKHGTLPKVVVVVHLCGQSADMEKKHQLSKTYGFHVIEDASHAIGGQYKNEYIGNCRYSDITIFSFHPVKIITTAEGGVAVTNSEELARKINLHRSHGITRDPHQFIHPTHSEAWYYEQIALGFNYRMTEMQAALGLSQLTRLDEYINTRHSIRKKYDTTLSELPIVLPWQHPDTFSAFHLYPILIDNNRTSYNRKQVFDALRKAQIGVNVHYIPIHTQPYYAQMGFTYSDFPNAVHYYERTISIPIFQTLSSEDQDIVINTLFRIFSTT